MAALLPSPIDRSLKALVRRVPAPFLRLAGLDVDPRRIRSEDITINLPEYRADQILILGEEGKRNQRAIHIEFQLRPDRRVLEGWFLKNAALTAQLRMPTVLLVTYLSRGRYRSFPSSYEATLDRLCTGFTFDTLHLWEHTERIRTGELPELAPLLVLCEDTPEEHLLEEERRLILGINAPRETKADLLAVAVTVGARFFAREVVLAHFSEELQMLKNASFVEEWIAEAQKETATRSHAEGRAEGTRALLLQLLQDQFGLLPASVVDRVNSQSPEWCLDLARRLRNADSLADLGF